MLVNDDVDKKYFLYFSDIDYICVYIIFIIED